METKQTAKIGSSTCENNTNFSKDAADSKSQYSESSGSEAREYNLEDGLVSELKKFILDDEASDSISVDKDDLSVQENVSSIQREWNEFGEAINEDWKHPTPLRATVPQVLPVQEPFNFRASWNNLKHDYYLLFIILLCAMDIALLVYFGTRLAYPLSLINIVLFSLTTLGIVRGSSRAFFAAISISVFKMLGFLSLLIILLVLEIDEDLINEDIFIIGNLVEKPKYILYPLFITCKRLFSFSVQFL